MTILPVSAIIATRNRAESIRNTLNSLAEQECFPKELIVVDASDGGTTQQVVTDVTTHRLQGCSIICQAARATGAAIQRNQGIAEATQPFIWFFDDDVLFEPGCLERLWNALQTNPQLGGVNALITNQNFVLPGRISHHLYRWLDDSANATSIEGYAGRCIGPVVTFLPQDRADLPEVVPVEWLNTTCTLYRREAIPDPPFDRFFSGYSLGEDVALSQVVARRWKLANVRTARIYHDMVKGGKRASDLRFAQMELVNRHFIMTDVMGKRRVVDYARLLLLEAFGLTSSLKTLGGWKSLPVRLAGKLLGAATVAKRLVKGTRQRNATSSLPSPGCKSTAARSV